ncbi:complex I intermediate-associated CIA30 domain containing protein [Nitzschia inconspicua]|uniref:Complex I intermediate-associated CIA30 domain containing protein n=1 Tax=Nitzschia inconspicua TaxID=303405 RepID=A0A9K3PE17_9STRA|nr:complex I intermediate-associated CIA30 domain containing protein [Nitzschia inconspicua]KAG7343570.1 complex I intermediate-associated CIA30 domain containing protein [Nitzschia inconspicua]
MVPSCMSSSSSLSSDPSDSETTTSIVLEDFANPQHDWTTMNDPVMGGQSHSQIQINDGIAHFTGTCAVVPSLNAPGFITMVTGAAMPWDKPGSQRFPDISSCTAFQLQIKSNTSYQGYRLSFGRAHPSGNRFAFGYKTPLANVPMDDDFGTITLPFDSFSSKWDDATGDIQVSCHDNTEYCPSQSWLQNIQTMSFWGEGVQGDIDLEIKTISAVGCTTTSNSTTNTNPNNNNNSISNFHRMTLSAVAVVGIVGWMWNRRRRQQRRYNLQTVSYQEINDVPTSRMMEL